MFVFIRVSFLLHICRDGDDDVDDDADSDDYGDNWASVNHAQCCISVQTGLLSLSLIHI